jgi:hypothetical protein
MSGMIVGQFVNDDLNLGEAPGFINLFSKGGAEYAKKRFDQPSFVGLENIQHPIVEIRKRFRKDRVLEEKIVSSLKIIAENEDAVTEISQTETIDKRILETVEQVFWKPDAFGSQLNAVGLVIELILIWKTLVLPGFAVLTPVIVIVLPYILLKTVFGLTIPVDEYAEILKNMILSNVPNVQFGNEPSPLTIIVKYGYILMSAGVFISNIWNQIQAAIHLRAVAEDIRSRGLQIVKYVNACSSLAQLLDDKEGIAFAKSVGFNEETFSLGAYGANLNNSRNLLRLREWASNQDLRISLARMKGICFPKIIKGSPVFEMEINGLYHPGVPAGKRVLNSIKFSEKDGSNILITGPNRGGKSTMCKSVGFAIMCAQSWGIAFAKSMKFTPVSRFETALAPADTLGRLSLFEAEIEFAKHLLAISNKAKTVAEEAPVFIIMDEIFHSTNAHDGAEASLIFLKQLYDKGPRIASLISTHYRELPEKLPVRTLCMEAFDNGEKGIHYTYRCVSGISNISSVKEILKERGLISM